MANAAESAVRDQYTACLVRKCFTCQGTGQKNVVPYSALGQNTGMSAIPLPERCSDCINGFQFKDIPPSDFIDWVWQRLFDYIEQSPEVSAEFLELIVRATENKMTNPPVNWALAAGCGCTHAPEQHGGLGCTVVRSDLSSCPCRAKRLPR